MTLEKEKAINQEPKIIDLEQLFGAWQNPENRQILGSYLRKHQWDDVGSVVKNLNNLMGYVQNANFSAEDMIGKAM